MKNLFKKLFVNSTTKDIQKQMELEYKLTNGLMSKRELKRFEKDLLDELENEYLNDVNSQYNC